MKDGKKDLKGMKYHVCTIMIQSKGHDIANVRS